MGNLESKLLELKKAGKFDKFRIYVEIFEICFQQRNREIFVYFDKFIKAWREYLEFDDTPDNNLKEHFGDAFKSLFSFIRKSNDTDNFKKYFLVYKEFEKFIENDTAKIGIFNSFGYLFCFQQNFESAIKFSELSLKLINKTDDVLSFPSRYLNLGSIYEDKGDFNTAKKYYLQGLDYANRNNYQHAMHLALSALGRLKMSVREYEEAIEYLLKALELIDDDPKNDNRIIMIGNLAGCYTSLNNHKKSLEYYNLMPIEWLRDNKTEFYFPILINMAISELSLKNYPEAEKKLLIAAEYADNNNNLTILLPSLINLGILYRETNKYKKSISYFLNAIKIAEKKDNKHQIGDCYENIATAYKNDKQFKQAIEYYKKSYKLSTAQNQSTRVLVVLKALSECYSSIDQSSKAYKTLKKYVEIKDKYEEDLKKKGNKKSKDSTYEAGRSKQYKFSEGLSLISREMSNKIGEQIIGNSTAMDRVIQETFLTSRSSDASILLLGESGTGKDLIAKLIHFASIRHKGPFVAVNSAVFSAGLVQSALFGHRKGAFTGASYDHIGYFEEAHNGTIFLDEISEMPADIQANLLRILENKVVKRLGDNKNRKTDFRLVSATNKDIYSLIEKNKFRFDLFNRINTVEIHIPPLRDRKEDIPLLIEHFFNVISHKLQKKQPVISQIAINMLCDYDFPGNVRELKNIVERLILFSKNDKINKEDVYFLNSCHSEEIQSKNLVNLNLATNEKQLIMEALKRTGNVQIEAAKLLGIPAYTLNRRLKKMKN